MSDRQKCGEMEKFIWNTNGLICVPGLSPDSSAYVQLPLMFSDQLEPSDLPYAPLIGMS